MSKSLDSFKPGPGRWGSMITPHAEQYLNTLHTIADAELSADKAVLNFWATRGRGTGDIVVRMVAEQIRKIAYREGWWAAGDVHPTRAVAWRICYDWSIQK